MTWHIVKILALLGVAVLSLLAIVGIERLTGCELTLIGRALLGMVVGFAAGRLMDRAERAR